MDWSWSGSWGLFNKGESPISLREGSLSDMSQFLLEEIIVMNLQTKLARAIQYEEDKKYNEAYQEYLSCIEIMIKSLQNPVITQRESEKLSKLSKECVARSELISSQYLNLRKSVTNVQNQQIKQILDTRDSKNVSLSTIYHRY